MDLITSLCTRLSSSPSVQPPPSLFSLSLYVCRNECLYACMPECQSAHFRSLPGFFLASWTLPLLSVCLSVCPFVCVFLSACLSVCRSVCRSVLLSPCQSVCLCSSVSVFLAQTVCLSGWLSTWLSCCHSLCCSYVFWVFVYVFVLRLLVSSLRYFLSVLIPFTPSSPTTCCAFLCMPVCRWADCRSVRLSVCLSDSLCLCTYVRM